MGGWGANVVEGQAKSMQIEATQSKARRAQHKPRAKHDGASQAKRSPRQVEAHQEGKPMPRQANKANLLWSSGGSQAEPNRKRSRQSPDMDKATVQKAMRATWWPTWLLANNLIGSGWGQNKKDKK